MEKQIRARFGLEGAPLRIFLKARSRAGQTTQSKDK
jgi:predicted GTPase